MSDPARFAKFEPLDPNQRRAFRRHYAVGVARADGQRRVLFCWDRGGRGGLTRRGRLHAQTPLTAGQAETAALVAVYLCEHGVHQPLAGRLAAAYVEVPIGLPEMTADARLGALVRRAVAGTQGGEP